MSVQIFKRSLSYLAITILFGGVFQILQAHETTTQHAFVHTNRQSAVKLARPDSGPSFTFAIFGDRTGTHDPAGSMKILTRAISEVNTIGPDMVLTVGDLINGYNQTDKWIGQMKEFQRAMGQLKMPWFPVAGNHDVYWRGGNRPKTEHDEHYEKYFGPLWYAFEHKGCWFIILYSDEGDPRTGEKSFSKPTAQTMSQQQKAWLQKTLKTAKDAKHVFLFLHHPRWRGRGYGNDWNNVHSILKAAGNVSAVFAGHIHTMTYSGKKDGIDYFTLGVVGGDIPEENPPRGRLNHYDLITVRGDDFYVAAVPVGSVIDPKAKRLEIKTLLPQQEWKVTKDSQRLLTWRVLIPAYQGLRAELRIEVKHGADDTGDKGIHYSLLNVKGKPISNGFLARKGVELIKYPVEPSQQYSFTLNDHDTEFNGSHPGNIGQINIKLDVVLK